MVVVMVLTHRCGLNRGPLLANSLATAKDQTHMHAISSVSNNCSSTVPTWAVCGWSACFSGLSQHLATLSHSTLTHQWQTSQPQRDRKRRRERQRKAEGRKRGDQREKYRKRNKELDS